MVAAGAYSREAGEAAANRLLADRSLTAIAAANDLLALGAMRALAGALAPLSSGRLACHRP